MSKELSDNASETLTGELTEEGVTKLFADARKKFVNNKVSNSVAWVAYVNADIYNFLIDSKLATTDKNSSANIDEQSMYKFKGFVLVELPDDKFSFPIPPPKSRVGRGKRILPPSGKAGVFFFT